MSNLRLTVAASVALACAGPVTLVTSAAAASVPVDVFYPNVCASQLSQLHSDGSSTSVATPGPITSLAAAPVTGTLAYTVSDAAGNTDVYLTDYTGTSRRRVAHIANGSGITGWSADGTQLWMFNKIYSTLTGQVTTIVPTGNYHGGIPDPLDPSAYFDQDARIANGSSTTLMPLPGIKAVSPDGTLLAGISGDNPAKLVVIQRDGTVINPSVNSSSSSAAGFGFSPNDDYLYGFGSTFFGKGQGETWLVRDDISKQEQTPEELTPHVPCLGNRNANVAVVPTDATAPHPAGGVSVSLDGAHPTLSWANPADRDFSHVVISRYEGSSATGTPTLLTAGYHATSFTDAVTVGSTYTYVLTAVDGAGNAATATTPVTMRALAAPSLHTPARSSDAGTTAPFPVSWGAAGASASTRYTVQYLNDTYDYPEAFDSSWSTWLDHVNSTGDTFGTAGQPLSLAVGDHVPFRVRAYDDFGNPTIWTTGTRSAQSPTADPSRYVSGLATLVPFDDDPSAANTDRHDSRYHDRLSYSSGWTAVRNSSDWLGGLRTTRRGGASVTFRLDHSQGPLFEGIPGKLTVFQLIGDRCAHCGSFRVYVDGTLKGTYSAHATTTQHRRVIATIRLGKGSWHRKVVVVNVPTKQGSQLRVDGFAVP